MKIFIGLGLLALTLRSVFLAGFTILIYFFTSVISAGILIPKGRKPKIRIYSHRHRVTPRNRRLLRLTQPLLHT